MLFESESIVGVVQRGRDLCRMRKGASEDTIKVTLNRNPMTIERYRKVRLFFEQIVELTPAQQSTVLMNAHRNDPELAAEVEALMIAYSRRAGFIERPITTLKPPEEQPRPVRRSREAASRRARPLATSSWT